MNKCEWLGCNGTVDRNGRCLQCEVKYLKNTLTDLEEVLQVRRVNLVAVDGVIMLEKDGIKLPMWRDENEAVRIKRELQAT